MQQLRRSPGLARALLVLVACSLTSGCLGGSKATRRYKKEEVQQSLEQLETPGLYIGEFPLADKGVIDGDTIKVVGLKTTIRLLAIDTEETFKSEADRQLYAQGWQHYWLVKNSEAKGPVKAATPLGEEAKKFAKTFFAGAGKVRLERDHPKDIRGRYGRYLGYAFVKRNGRWVNYNIECVRAGMSPYFSKYGYSMRFHEQFVLAQQEAQQAHRGIWRPGAEAYSDYPERLRWWTSRADFARAFLKEAADKDNYVVLTHWDAPQRLEQLEGREAVILGAVGKITLGDSGPSRVLLSRRQFSDFPLIFFDKDVFGSSSIARFQGEIIQARGVISLYRNKHNGRENLQMVINQPTQIRGPGWVPDFSGWSRRALGTEAKSE